MYHTVVSLYINIIDSCFHFVIKSAHVGLLALYVRDSANRYIYSIVVLSYNQHGLSLLRDRCYRLECCDGVSGEARRHSG